VRPKFVPLDEALLDFSRAMRCDGSIDIHRCKSDRLPIFTFPVATAGAADVITLPTPRLRRRRSDIFFRSQVAKSPSR
jgi:hypothetical protein